MLRVAVAFNKLGGVFPAFALVLPIGVILSVVVFCTSVNDQPPKHSIERVNLRVQMLHFLKT